MGNIGSSELLLILVLALLLLGPRRLPEVGASLGKMMRRFRQASRDLRGELDVDRALRLDDDDDLARPVPMSTEARRAPQSAAQSAAATAAAPSEAPATPTAATTSAPTSATPSAGTATPPATPAATPAARPASPRTPDSDGG